MFENKGIIHEFDWKWCNDFDLFNKSSQVKEKGDGDGEDEWLMSFTKAEWKGTTSENKNKVWANDTTLYNTIYDQY